MMSQAAVITQLEGAPTYHVCPNCSQWLSTNTHDWGLILHPQIVQRGEDFVFPKVAQGYFTTEEGKEALANLQEKIEEAEAVGDRRAARNFKETIKIFSDPAFPRPDWRPIQIESTAEVVCKCDIRVLIDWSRHIPKKKPKTLPTQLPQSTFLEARATTHALSDARTLQNWEEIEGMIAMLHKVTNAQHQLRFEPSALLTSWWGYPATMQSLRKELMSTNFETIVTFKVILACILQSDKARWTGSLDDLIKMTGRNTDARRSQSERNKLRTEIWRNLLIFDSLPVIGARPEHGESQHLKAKKQTKCLNRSLCHAIHFFGL